MSRLLRYKDSLHRFIKDKSCLLDKANLPDENTETLLYNRIKDDDLILPILLLTIMNSQNKKNGITVQGYYAAASIEFLYTMMNLIENEANFTKKDTINKDNYNKLINYLMICSNKSLCQNLEAVKDNKDSKVDSSANIFINSMKIYNENLSYTYLLGKHDFILSDDEPSRDVSRWYIRDDNSLDELFKKIKQVDKESFKTYMEKRMGSVTEIAVCVGWIIGNGDIKKLKKVKKLAKYFAILYKLMKDFENIESDIRNNNEGLSRNYIINYGIQDGYDYFMENKHNFIEEAMNLDLYTSTVKEIVSFIESKVDVVIEDTSPDLKSSYSKK